MLGGPSTIARTSQEAARAFAEGKIAVAEAKARTVLDRAPEDAGCWNLLGVIAAQLGHPELAAEYFSRALKRDPDLVSAKDNLSIVRCAPMRATPPEGERILVIEAWGSGFWSDLCHVLGCLLLAEITGRVPVTHWGGNSLFSVGTEDAFRYYFERVSPLTLDEVRARPGASFFPPLWSKTAWPVPGARVAEKTGLPGLTFLNRPETVAVSDSYVSVFQLLPWIPKTHPLHGQPVDAVYRALFEKYLRPQGTVLTDADRFYGEHLAGAPSIAVHARGSDKWSEMRRGLPGPGSYFEMMEREDPSARIFLLTDDLRVLAQFRERFGDRIVATPCQRTNADIGLHMQRATDRARLVHEVMLDVLVALRCGKFFGMGWSNVSAIIAMLKSWAPDTCFLLGPSILMDRFV